MTVIACKDRVMAADSGVWQGGVWLPSAGKLSRLYGGTIAGVAGWRPEWELALRWYQAGAPPDSRPPNPSEKSDLDVLLLKPNGEIWNLTENFRLFKSEWPIAVAGSHTEFVLGALLAGASAKQAVELACAHCSYARPPVVTMSFDDR
jgi:hypothetical protein